ncbi:hypothetical protein [Mycobacteroides abscessus]|uniref:hypothetical protein n=1 Tax=Mycobacteroides abscessus TaxID=36809 RepID=UPI001041C413|nr:hypothetical protein [Mycobacteroides abscessus]
MAREDPSRPAEKEAGPLEKPDRALAMSASAEFRKWDAINTGFICLCVPVTIAALWFPVTALAGKTTNFDLNVNFVVSITLVLTLTQAGTLYWGRHRSKAAKQAEERADRLKVALDQSRTENEFLKERVAGLQDDLSRSRELGEAMARHRSDQQ